MLDFLGQRGFAMKTSYLLVLLAIVGGTATSIGKSLLEPNDAYEKQEKLLAHYRASPDATLKKISAAFLVCADSKYGNDLAAAEIRQLAARIVLEAISQRVQNVEKVDGRKRILQLIKKHLPAIKERFAADRDFEELNTYIEALSKNDVPSCVISSVA